MDNDTYQGWLRYYRMAHTIKSPARYNEERTRRVSIDTEIFEDFIQNVSYVLRQSSIYLNKRGYKLPKPLWKYNPDDETTWASSPNFAYGHLLKGA